MTNIMAKPATPPTMPPTSTGVGGAPLPPELPFEPEEGGGVGVVLPELPFVPGPATLALDITDAKDAWLESCDDADVVIDVANVVGADVIPRELVLEARFWRDVLGFVTLEIEATIAEILASED